MFYGVCRALDFLKTGENQKCGTPWKYIQSSGFEEVVHSLGFDLDVREKWCLVSVRFGCLFDSLGCGLNIFRKRIGRYGKKRGSMAKGERDCENATQMKKSFVRWASLSPDILILPRDRQSERFQ